MDWVDNGTTVSHDLTITIIASAGPDYMPAIVITGLSPDLYYRTMKVMKAKKEYRIAGFHPIRG